MSANSKDLAKRTPPGQALTTKWPVLTYGLTPKFDPKTWAFRCFGLVEEEVSWTWDEFLVLPRTEVHCDIHCVTRWSRLDNRFEGVHIREIMKRVRLRPEAKFALIHADPDYATNLPLGDLVDDDVVLALRHDGKDLEPDHGGPLKGPYLYDLSLKGHANAATQPDDRYAPSATQRPADLPYRGRPNQGKRKASGAPKPDRRSDPPQTWHDVYADR